MGSRRKARELALQMLYRHEATGVDATEILRDFEELQKAGEETRKFALELFNGTVGQLVAVDEELEQQTAKWRLDRLAAVDRNILRVGAFEMLHDGSTPAAVIIDEAIEIAKRFGSEDSARFVNGVLDGLRRRKLGT